MGWMGLVGAGDRVVWWREVLVRLEQLRDGPDPFVPRRRSR